MTETAILRPEFVASVKGIIEKSRTEAIRSVDFQRVLMYWHIGKSIFKEEQQSRERAEYGAYLVRNLSHQLVPVYGSGFSVRLLELSRQFYRVYPIANTLCSQLNWSQYRRPAGNQGTSDYKFPVWEVCAKKICAVIS